MSIAATYHVLITEGAQGLADPVLGLLRRAGLRLVARELEGAQLPDEIPGAEVHDLLLLFADVPGQANEALLRELQLSRRDIPCLLICQSPARWLPMLGLGAAGLFSEAQLASAAGQVQFVYQVNRELEQLRQRRDARRAMSSAREMEQRLELFMEHTSDAVACLQDGLHQYANSAWQNFFGVKNWPDLEALPFLDLVAEQDVDEVRDFLQQSYVGTRPRCEFTALRRDGRESLSVLESSVVSLNGEPALQVIARIADGNVARLDAIQDAHNRDIQSGLLNADSMTRMITQAISAAVHLQRHSALLMITSHQLADIAVVLGKHDTHLLMRDIAAVLIDRCPDDAVLGRLDSGDFIALLPGSDAAQSHQLIQKLEQLIPSLQKLVPPSLTLNFDLGAAMITDEAPDAATVMARARQHQTLRRHKLQRRETGPDNSIPLEQLRQALHDETLLLVYQPTVCLRADNREYYEVRVRLPAGDRLIHPAEFLDAANQYGYGERLDRYVVTQALRAVAAQKNPDLRLTINLTANSLLSRTMMTWLPQELKRQQQNPRQLILQISELDILGTPDLATEFCQQLRELGFEFSLAHFGCSLDPFRLLSQVNADYVKLDQSLVQHIDIDARQRERLQEVVASLHAQGVRVVAPMIEDVELLPLLWQANVNFVQGYCLQQPSTEMDFGLFRTEEVSLPRSDLHSETL